MIHRFRTAFALAGAIGLAACASTKFKSTWKAPDAGTLSFKGKKVLALCITPREDSRKGAEGALAYELNARGVAGVPAYTVIPAAEIKDKEAVKARIQAAGFAGAVVMRAVGGQQEIGSSPAAYWGGYYESFSGYYGYGWGAVADPGYVRIDTFVSVETLIYDVQRDKLVWAAISESKNPQSAETLVRDLAAVAAQELKKQGLAR